MKKKKVGKRITHRKNTKLFAYSYHFLLVSMGCLLLFFTGSYTLYKKLSPPPCANSISCISDLSGKSSTQTQGVFMGKTVQALHTEYFAQNIEQNNPVLGTTTAAAEKHIYVDLSAQRLYAFQGNTIVYNFPVSTGKWHLTPTGTFHIWIKLQATRMTGGDPAIGTFYDLPNVPWTMYFYNNDVSKSQGYSLHGAYWHNNFGHAMSHGCVNISPDNAKLLYDWAEPATLGNTTYATSNNPGTIITIYGVTPKGDLPY